MPRNGFSKIDALPEKDRQQIESLAKNGYSFKYIAEWLETKGFNIHIKTVQNWHKKYLESIAPNDEKAEKALKAVEKLERDTTANPIIDDEKELERIRQSWDVPNISTLDTNPELAVGASQKMAYDLFMSVGILTKNRLNLYQKGECKFPIEQVKALKLLYEMYAPLLGVSELVSPNAAIKSLESFGYNLEGLKNANDTDSNQSEE